MQLNWHETAVQAALLQASGAVVATFLGGLIALVIGWRASLVRKLQEDLHVAHQDIAYLLRVEAKHCDEHAKIVNKSMKRTIRKMVEEEGNTWSGKFTPGRIRAKSGKPPIPPVHPVIQLAASSGS